MTVSDTPFYRITFHKLDDQGQVKTYTIKNRFTGNVLEKKTVLSAIVDRATGALYRDESESVVRIKCAAIALTLPFYQIGIVVWHTVRTPLAALSSFFALVRNGTNWELFQKEVRSLSREVYEGVSSILWAPIYWIPMELSACIGLVSPYLGRKHVAAFEYSLHGGIPYREGFVHIPERSNESCCTAFLKDISFNKPLYLADCFQVRGNLNDRDIQVITTEPLR